ncbi:protein ITPRID2 isoform X4 [Simochromis diagramma]|uniref:protein ITPRID2 isoform X4 n=1 Tax=Simochromis diagramma TaxID=43689 RepID=UPI001A7ED4E3|nr:protein ITPRID2 isoform X4 [Simochromis diagramma]
MESGALAMEVSTGLDSTSRRQAWAKTRESVWQDSNSEHLFGPQEPQQSQSNGNTQGPTAQGQVPNNKIASWLNDCRTPLGASLDDQSASPSRGPLKNGCSFEDDLSLGAEANYPQTKACFDLAADQKRSQYKEKGKSMNSTGSGKSSTVSSVSELLDLYEEDPEEILLNLGFGREEPDLSSKIPSRFFNSSSSARGIDIKVYLAAQLQRMEVENPNYALTKSTEAQTPNQQMLTNGHEAPADAPASAEQDGSSTNSHHQAEVVSPKHIRKKDNCPLATVTEETSGDGETGSLTDNRPEQHTTDPDLQSTNQGTGEGTQVVKEVEKRNSTPEKAPHTLAPPRPAHLRTENADSFEIEEINEDEANPHRTSRSGVDLSRTGSQQSDSSGFAEEPSADLNSHLKVQVSSDSCDSETTVTSHPSQDVATPLAMDKPAFDLPDGREEEARPGEAAESDRGNSSREEHMDTETSEQIPQYTAHHLPRSRPVQQDETLGKENVERRDRTDPDPEPESAQSMPAAEQQAQPESKESQHDSEQGPEHTQNPTETEGDTDTSTEKTRLYKVKVEPVFLDDSKSLCPVALASPVHSALDRAKQSNRTASQRRGISMQRSSSLPSSLLSPCKIVSSVRIQFGQGLASCTQPKYSFKYTPEPEDKEEEENGREEKEEEEVEEEPTNCLSTLIINPASSSSSKKKSPAVFPPKPIPRYLMRPSYSLQSPSPPPDWPSGVNAESWSTQSVPDLSSNPQQPAHFQQNMNAYRNQPSLNPEENLFPNSHRSAQYPCPSPNLNQRFNSSPHPFMSNPAFQYTPPHLHGSLPNLHHHHSPSVNHHCSLTSLLQPSTSPGPQHDSMSNLHPLSTPTSPHHIPPGHLHPGPSGMYHPVYNHQYSHQQPYQLPPQGSQFGSPYFSHQGYNPYLSFPHHTHLHPTVSPEHSLHPGLAPPPGFHIGMGLALSPGHNLHPGLRDANAPGPGPGQSPSSTEMQLRRVLHEIRGTVQSLNRADTPDTFSEPRATLPNHQTLAEFQQKRRSLNLFRSQMMDLELAIIRQQAPVYNHLSPADRLELEQLQSLRSAVREELQELEQQLEDRLELTHRTQHRGLHRDFSVESLSTASALRAMEPVSDLLREQLFLQSEIGSDRHSSYTNPSPRSVSPVREDQGGGDGKQKQGMYRASINITPAPPPRPNVHTEETEEEERASDGAALAAGGGGRGEAPEVEEGAAGEVRVDSLQQLIKEIRESVAQEVRREIFSELLAAVSPRPSPLPARQPPV